MSRPMPTRSLAVAYVIPMGSGLHSFVFREIRELVNNGVSVHLFPTKIGVGPYHPEPAWPVHRATPSLAAVAHLRSLLRNPKRYLSTLLEALAFGAWIDFAIAAFVSEKTLSEGLRLVHCHFGDHKLFIGYFAGRLADRPTSVTIHAYELYRNPNPRLFRRILRRIHAIVTVAEYNRAILESSWSVSSERVNVIPLFTDLAPQANHQASRREPIVILTVARFVEKKGHRLFLQALAKLPEGYEAWIVGSGPLDVAGMARVLGIEDRVRILGRVDNDELEHAYDRADLFCLPSVISSQGDREGIPVALMEAMAHGLPVVASQHAGIPELVEATLVDEGDVDAIALAIKSLGEDLQLRVRQGERNREIIATRYSKRNALRLVSLFEGLAV